MASIRQIQANQQNAQLSTGPRTGVPAVFGSGKAAVAQNALKSGIESRSQTICGENPVDFDALHAEYYNLWSPTTPEQRTLVDTLISNEWLLRRYRRVETHIWQDSMPGEELRLVVYLSQAFGKSALVLDRVLRHKNAARSNYQSALRELKLLKKEELAAAEPLNPTPIRPQSSQTMANQPTSPQIGFVPQPP